MARKNHLGTIIKWGLALFAVFLFLMVLFVIMIPVFIIIAATEDIERGVGNVARIHIHGPIVSSSSDSLFGDTVVGSADIVALIKEADENENIEAILLDINSGGGSVVASEEIMTAVAEAEKPTIALIRDVGASGAYWVASAADHVVASPVSITGSIGVTASYLELSGLFEEYGIGYERLVAGDYKDTGTPFRDLTAEEEVYMQTLLDDIHDHFIVSVANNRGMSLEETRDVATGAIYTGQRAMRLGLVDELGNQDVAEEAIMELADIDHIEISDYRGREPLFGSIGIEAPALLTSKQSLTIRT